MSSPDAGAREIRRLLTAPNPAFKNALRRLTTALPRAIDVATGSRDLRVPSTAFDAIYDLRLIVRALSRRIAAIDTKRAESKRRVLDGLDQLDFSLVLFEESMLASGETRVAALARDAYWQRAHAYTELKSVLEVLR